MNLKKRFGDTPTISSSQGEVIVLFEQGLVPKQDEFKHCACNLFITWRYAFDNLAMPVYKNNAYVRRLNNINIDAQSSSRCTFY
ncbi:hypothetical protein P4S63_22415 [Pseudoalteromonas sp. B193]